ncbi:hypothetical protein RKE38_08475 [Phycicoccus sp. M110.8]|uniref:hypothetical protein n=1 Tax=Phycicoccus sp. M110.8 TaxID=3075433 RepID=UPI0028FDAF69|nr:hypothetical protein [Phycicoccus sp. M110.8]MDU0313721.1 hypothetical protein [Phycicoccus sp. M110.8]
MLAAVVAEGVAIVLLGLLVLGLLRSHALILRALHELGAGLELEKEADTGVTRATSGGAPGPVPVELESGVVPATRHDSARGHDVVGTALDRTERRHDVTAPGSRTLLAFLTSGCSVCQTFWEEFQHDVDVPGNGRLVVVAKGPEEESPSALKALAGRLEVVQSSRAWVDYDIPGSPYFVYVEAGTVTGEGSATTWAQVRDLMAQGVADADEARVAAGRSGPGAVGPGAVGPVTPGDDGGRDSLTRIDAELRASGITPGHPSLFVPPDPEPVAADGSARHHDHDHAAHDHAGHDHAGHGHDHHGHQDQPHDPHPAGRDS